MRGLLMDKESGLPLLFGEGADSIEEDSLRQFMTDMAACFGLGHDGEEETPLEQKAPQPSLEEVLASNAELLSMMAYSKLTFTPTDSYGEVEMAYSLDASALADKTTVVFEMLTSAESVVAMHADLDDVGQTAGIVPSMIDTSATDAYDGDQEIIAEKDAAIEDEVSYSNLLPGKEYVLEGTLMDKDSGEPLLIGGKKVTARHNFTPNHADGKASVEFKFDATELAGRTIVVFERLTKDGALVAEHADLDSERQTVKVSMPPEGEAYDKTGNILARYGWILGLLAASSISACGYGVYQLKRRQTKDVPEKD